MWSAEFGVLWTDFGVCGERSREPNTVQRRACVHDLRAGALGRNGDARVQMHAMSLP